MSKGSIDFKQKRKFTKEEVEELSARYRKASSLKLREERGDWGNGGFDDDKRRIDLFASIDKNLDKIIAILENDKKKK